MRHHVASYITILLCRVEARTGLSGKISVPVNLCPWIELPQVGEQVQQRCLLGICPRVLRVAAVAGTAADVGHADAVAVVARAVRSAHVHVAPLVHVAVAVDDVVVAYVAPTAPALADGSGMPSAYVVDGVVLALGGGGAVHDDLGDGASAPLQLQQRTHHGGQQQGGQRPVDAVGVKF